MAKPATEVEQRLDRIEQFIEEAKNYEMDVEFVAKCFHETYERLAAAHGYETRPESAVPWEHVPIQNRALMVAVVKDLSDKGVII